MNALDDLSGAHDQGLARQDALYTCEHGLAPDDGVRRWQHRLTPVWKPIAGGCHLNRDIPALIEAGGFRIGELAHRYLKGPKPMTYVYSGVAHAA